MAKTWVGSVSKDWSTASNWSPAQLPGILDDVTIGSAGNNPVVSTSGTAENLTINQGATLSVTAGTSAATLSITSSLFNNGVINLSGQQAAPANLVIGGSNSTNSGQIILSDSLYNLLDANHAGAFTNSGTISGAGNFAILATCTLINKGTINANGTMPLDLNRFNNGGPFNATNSGLIEATNSGGLVIWGSTIDSSGGGSIQANGAQSKVDLKGATLIGGTLLTQGGGIIEAADLVSVLQDLTNLGTIAINKTTGLSLRGTIKNDGTIKLNGDTATAALGIMNNATLSGAGNIVLSDSTHNIIQSVSSASIFTNSTNTISGAGSFLSMTLVNSGMISATYSDNALTLATTHTITNNGTLKAGGGILIINDAVSGTGTQLITDGGTLVLNGGSQEDTIFAGSGFLQLGKNYLGSISGFSTDDSVDLTYVSSSNFGAGPNNLHGVWTENSSNTGGTLAIIDPAKGTTPVATVNFSGVYSSADFAISNDGQFHPLIKLSNVVSGHIVEVASGSNIVVSDPDADIRFPSDGIATVEYDGPTPFRGAIWNFAEGDVFDLGGKIILDATVSGSQVHVLASDSLDGTTQKFPFQLASSSSVVSTAADLHGGTKFIAFQKGGLQPFLHHTGHTESVAADKIKLVDDAIGKVIAEYSKNLGGSGKLNIQVNFVNNLDRNGEFAGSFASADTPVFVKVGKDSTKGLDIYQTGLEWMLSHKGANPWNAKDTYQTPNFFNLQPMDSTGRLPDVVLNLNVDKILALNLGSGAPPTGQINLFNLLLHEFGHAFGITTLEGVAAGKETVFDSLVRPTPEGDRFIIPDTTNSNKTLLSIPVIRDQNGAHFVSPATDPFSTSGTGAYDIMNGGESKWLVDKPNLKYSGDDIQVLKFIDPPVYGVLPVFRGTTLELSDSVFANDLIAFTSGDNLSSTLLLDIPFNGSIRGLISGDKVILNYLSLNNIGLTSGSVFLKWVQNSDDSSGILSVVDAKQGSATLTSLSIDGFYSPDQFILLDDGNFHPKILIGNGNTTNGVTPSTIQGDYSAITRNVLALDQAINIAGLINAGSNSEAKYVESLLSQVASTTIPAVAVEASMYGITGTSAEITKLVTQFLPAQVANATANGYNTQVYACEALGLVFAFGDENGGTAFSSNFGSSKSTMPNTAVGDAAFAAAAASAIFGSSANANTPGAIATFVTNWKAFFTANGIVGITNATSDQIDLAARGAAWGDAVGIALANNLGLLPGQVTNFLKDAAQGTAVYSASLASQPAAGTFPGAPSVPVSVDLVGVSIGAQI